MKICPLSCLERHTRGELMENDIPIINGNGLKE
jgi:hypothetical protein